jgi:hypothetical protein
MPDRGFFVTRKAMDRQIAAMPSEIYLVRLLHSVTRRALAGERLWTAQELTRGSVVRFLRARNRQGWDVYLQPFAGDHNAGYILLDLDHPRPQVVDRMRAAGHQPCVLLRTSPGHLQAWVQVSLQPVPPVVATALGRHLASLYGGDPASTDWRHLGRLAGFTNQKPQRRGIDYAPWIKILHAQTGLASAAPSLLEVATASAHPATVPICSPPPQPLPRLRAEAARAIYQRWVQRWCIPQRFTQPDWSIVDLWVARKLLAQHIPLSQIETILRLGSPQFPRRHSNPDDYLRRTLARAAFPTSPRCVISYPTPPPAPSRPEAEEGSGPHLAATLRGAEKRILATPSEIFPTSSCCKPSNSSGEQ